MKNKRYRVWMTHDTDSDVWSVEVDIVEKNINKIMDYILNLPTEGGKL